MYELWCKKKELELGMWDKESEVILCVEGIVARLAVGP